MLGPFDALRMIPLQECMHSVPSSVWSDRCFSAIMIRKSNARRRSSLLFALSFTAAFLLRQVLGNKKKSRQRVPGMRNGRKSPPFFSRETDYISKARARQEVCHDKKAKQFVRSIMKALTPYRSAQATTAGGLQAGLEFTGECRNCTV